MSGTDPKITRDQARKRLAVLLYPEEMAGDNDAKRRVRTRLRKRIKEAVERGEITTDTDMADVSFCEWVIKEYKDRLTGIKIDWFPDCFPESRGMHAISSSIELRWDIFDYNAPTNPEELKASWWKQDKEIKELKARITELESENQGLRDRLSKWGRPKGGD